MVSESKLYYGVMRDMGYEPSNNVFQSMLDLFIRVSERFVVLMWRTGGRGEGGGGSVVREAGGGGDAGTFHLAGEGLFCSKKKVLSLCGGRDWT